MKFPLTLFRTGCCAFLTGLTLTTAVWAAPIPSSGVLVGEMDRVLAAAFPADGPGASVLIAQRGEVLLRKGYGMADLELATPMRAEQVLPLCSITKQFTAVAILQLVEAGKLKLNDELSRYVPDYPTGGATVTIEELLAHSSGLPSIEEQPEARKRWREDLTPDQLLDYTRNHPLAFAPGTNWKYSNTGYYLLGRVIEKVSGQRYPEYLRARLLLPAGLKHTVYPEGVALIPGRGSGYSRSGDAWVNAAYLSLTQAYSAGALLASVDDLWSWQQALEDGRLLGKDLLQRACTEGHLPDGRGTHYGFGWEIGSLANHRMVGHAGGMPGFCSFEARLPDAGIYIAILCNTDAPSRSLRTLSERLVRVVLGERVPGNSVNAAIAPSDLGDYLGPYQIAPGATFTVTTKDGRLIGQLGSGRRPMAPVGVDEFSAGDDMHFRFVRDGEHRVVKVLVAPEGPGPELEWTRMAPAVKNL